MFHKTQVNSITGHTRRNFGDEVYIYIYDDDDDDDQWRYSPDRALASLTGFMMVYSAMWG
jgi:hypothetical protein